MGVIALANCNTAILIVARFIVNHLIYNPAPKLHVELDGTAAGNKRRNLQTVDIVSKSYVIDDHLFVGTLHSRRSPHDLQSDVQYVLIRKGMLELVMLANDIFPLNKENYQETFDLSGNFRQRNGTQGLVALCRADMLHPGNQSTRSDLLSAICSHIAMFYPYTDTLISMVWYCHAISDMLPVLIERKDQTRWNHAASIAAAVPCNRCSSRVSYGFYWPDNKYEGSDPTIFCLLCSKDEFDEQWLERVEPIEILTMAKRIYDMVKVATVKCGWLRTAGLQISSYLPAPVHLTHLFTVGDPIIGKLNLSVKMLINENNNLA